MTAEQLADLNAALRYCHACHSFHYRNEYLGRDLDWYREHCPQDVDHPQ